eukprot:TRINITY_DN14538_c0_g3_i1.p1 TRINITY_DN14538_c0_g3~~TRINITY_DN14538_c0_g3_i1.p1  ORF type:complete len:229 (-),score=-15.95 TRINITY_DN14538_c0_g3_i1:424-1110(-)
MPKSISSSSNSKYPLHFPFPKSESAHMYQPLLRQFTHNYVMRSCTNISRFKIAMFHPQIKITNSDQKKIPSNGDYKDKTERCKFIANKKQYFQVFKHHKRNNSHLLEIFNTPLFVTFNSVSFMYKEAKTTYACKQVVPNSISTFFIWISKIFKLHFSFKVFFITFYFKVIKYCTRFSLCNHKSQHVITKLHQEISEENLHMRSPDYNLCGQMAYLRKKLNKTLQLLCK